MNERRHFDAFDSAAAHPPAASERRGVYTSVDRFKSATVLELRRLIPFGSEWQASSNITPDAMRALIQRLWENDGSY